MRTSITILFILFTGLTLSHCKTVGSRQEYTVTVQEGDTLASIATKYNTTWFDILRDNGMKDARQLYVGQKIRVKAGPGGYLATGMQTHENGTERDAASPESTRGGLLFGNSSNSGGLSIKLPWPVAGSISSNFGWRWGRMHSGIDIRSPRGTPIRVPAKGRVTFAGRNGGYGNFILVDHGGYRTAYAHCSSIIAKRGEYVDVGDVIGKVGSTGNSSGSHLHFEYRTGQNAAVNPMQHLQSRRMMSALTIQDRLQYPN